MFVVGTAGHVDHGKSSLVEALTGTNPDRWLEERLRGMTIDLGFAHLRFEDGTEAGIVDVPGHERFLHNMLAGAAGMDVLLLVIDANEGVRTQTIEHLQIVGYLNVRHILVVATKMDLVEPQLKGEACRRIHAQLQETIAADAPIFAVSVVSGENLDVLKLAIHRALQSLPPRDANAPPYLPIDRVFTLPGLGTIVTGTLFQGSVSVGDTVALQPGDTAARVRSIQVFGSSRKTVDAGSRVALNVPGVDRHAIGRGYVAASLEAKPATSARVRFTPLGSALALLRRRVLVRAHIGSAEILGTLVFDCVPESTAETGAVLHLQRPAVTFPGLRFVLRRLSPKTLLGGGCIEGVAPGPNAGVADPLEETIRAILRELAIEPSTVHDVAARANVRDEIAEAALERLTARGEAILLQRPAAYVDARAAGELLERLTEVLERAQRAEPWAMGMTSLALARALGTPEPLLVRILAEFAAGGRIGHRAGYYATPDHRPTLTSEQRALFEGLVAVDRARPLLPVAFDAVLAQIRQSPAAGAGKALDTLLATGALVKVGNDLYRGSQIAQIDVRVREYLHANERMTAAEFRDLVGTSRKYAVPLLEWLDARGITLRDGDYRTLRKKSGRAKSA